MENSIGKLCSSVEDAVRLFKRIQNNALLEDRLDRGIYLGDLLIGFTNAVEIKDKKIEIGYVIDPAHHNKGVCNGNVEGTNKRTLSYGIYRSCCWSF